MKFSDDPKVWKRIFYGVGLVLIMPVLFPLAMIVVGLYKVGKSFDEYLERQ